MNSKILRGQTWHCRHQPSRHAFQYPMAWLCLDLDELSSLDQRVAWFGHNRRALFSISDANYAGPGDGTINEKIRRLIDQHGVHQPIACISLITLPRVLGYVFNPVSFYFCYAADDSLAVLVAEVRNTFGEAHHYVMLPQNVPVIAGDPIRFHAAKKFYVSPFLQVDGEYEVVVSRRRYSVSLVIHLRQDGQLVLSADMRGQTIPLTSRSLMVAMLRLPLMVMSVMLRIHWQAAQLFFAKHLPVVAKPQPASAATIPASRLSLWTRIRAHVLNRLSNSSENQPAPAPDFVSLKGRL